MKKLFIISILIIIMLSSCSCLYKDEVEKVKYEEKIYNDLWDKGDYYIYNWDMTMDSLLVLREKYKSHLKLKRKGGIIWSTHIDIIPDAGVPKSFASKTTNYIRL